MIPKRRPCFGSEENQFIDLMLHKCDYNTYVTAKEFYESSYNKNGEVVKYSIDFIESHIKGCLYLKHCNNDEPNVEFVPTCTDF